ncbi:MAG: ribosome maturation factor RimM [Cystobacterineae bacterium]|nr:ribosome maturation factor RimM [Cystobacterineae bacterium]
MKSWLQTGYVSRVFATHGEVVAKPFHVQSQSLRFAKRVRLCLKTGEERILGLRGRGSLSEGWRLLLEGIDTPEQARELVGARLWVAREEMPKLAPGEYFLEDWVGLEARLESGEVLGHVSTLLYAGPVPNLVIHGEGGGEWMVPWTDEYVPTLCMEEGYVVVRPLMLD